MFGALGVLDQGTSTSEVPSINQTCIAIGREFGGEGKDQGSRKDPVAAVVMSAFSWVMIQVEFGWIQGTRFLSVGRI